MPSKSKANKVAAYEAKVFDWSKKLWTAISKETNYSKIHDDIFSEFNILHDDAQALDITTVSMLSHVVPIYKHVASQGYEAHIHYAPLKEAVANYCEHKPVKIWIPPPQSSRSSSPSLPPSPRPKFPRSKESPPRNAGLTKKKGKGKVVISEELVLSGQDESEREAKTRERESAKPRERESAKPQKPPPTEKDANLLPTTDGMEANPTKCSICEQRGHVCHVNPKATKAIAACFECNHWRLKCSLASPRTKKAEADEEVAAPKEQGLAKRRKRPTQVSAGQPGQFAGRF